MNFDFWIKEQAKAHSRELRKTDRELVRDRHKLEDEERRLVRKNIFHKHTVVFCFSRQMKFVRMRRLGIKK